MIKFYNTELNNTVVEMDNEAYKISDLYPNHDDLDAHCQRKWHIRNSKFQKFEAKRISGYWLINFVQIFSK